MRKPQDSATQLARDFSPSGSPHTDLAQATVPKPAGPALQAVGVAGTLGSSPGGAGLDLPGLLWTSNTNIPATPHPGATAGLRAESSETGSGKGAGPRRLSSCPQAQAGGEGQFLLSHFFSRLHVDPCPQRKKCPISTDSSLGHL